MTLDDWVVLGPPTVPEFGSTALTQIPGLSWAAAQGIALLELQVVDLGLGLTPVQIWVTPDECLVVQPIGGRYQLVFGPGSWYTDAPEEKEEITLWSTQGVKSLFNDLMWSQTREVKPLN